MAAVVEAGQDEAVVDGEAIPAGEADWGGAQVGTIGDGSMNR
jgi:hypothetical protein